MLKRFLGIPKVQVGLGIMAVFLLVAAFGPWFSTHVLHMTPFDVDYMAITGKGPDSTHWWGTTSAGQDVLSWMLYGTRNSVIVGLASAVIGTILTVVIGTWAGFSGGAVDRFLNAFILVFSNIPTFAILFMIAGVMQNAGWLLVSLVIGCFEWSGGARQVRAQAMSLRGRDFTTALRTVGEKRYRIILFEVMPHLLGVISPLFLRLIAAGVTMQASLAFLGIGDPSSPSWGLMINWAMTQNALFRGMWWWFVPPGLALALIGLATTMINFGLDEITNPTLSTRRVKAMRRYLTRNPQAQGPATVRVSRRTETPGTGAPVEGPGTSTPEVTA